MSCSTIKEGASKQLVKSRVEAAITQAAREHSNIPHTPSFSKMPEIRRVADGHSRGPSIPNTISRDDALETRILQPARLLGEVPRNSVLADDVRVMIHITRKTKENARARESYIKSSTEFVRRTHVSRLLAARWLS